MQTNKLNSWIYRTLAQDGRFLTFDQLDQMLAKETKDWSDALRRSYLRGELGRMIRSGQIERDKNAARYKIGDDVNLFEQVQAGASTCTEIVRSAPLSDQGKTSTQTVRTLRERMEKKNKKMSEQTNQTEQYTQGVYAGPLTERAMDYNGHEAIGLQISDAAPDGSCLFVTIDDHLQLSVIPVIASSIRSYDPPEPPSQPESTDEDLQAATKALVDIINRLTSKPIDSPETLMRISIIAGDLASVWAETRRRAICAELVKPPPLMRFSADAITRVPFADLADAQICAQAAQAPGQALDGNCSADVPSAERTADAERETEQIVEVYGETIFHPGDFDRHEADFSESICQTCGHFLRYDTPTWIPSSGCRNSLRGAMCTRPHCTPDPGMVYCVYYARKETIGDNNPDYAEDAR